MDAKKIEKAVFSIPKLSMERFEQMEKRLDSVSKLSSENRERIIKLEDDHDKPKKEEHIGVNNIDNQMVFYLNYFLN